MSQHRLPRWTAWAGTTSLVICVTAAGRLMDGTVPRDAMGLIYLAAAVVAASAAGLGVAIYAAVLGFVAWDLFFFHPLYSVSVASVQDGISMAVFALVAVLTGSLASRLRAEVRSGRARIDSLRRIGEFSRRLGEPATEAELAAEIARQAGGIAGHAVVLTSGEDGLRLLAAHPAGEMLDEAGWLAARRAWQARLPAGQGAAAHSGSDWRLLPMGTARGVPGVLAVRPPPGRPLDAPAQQALLALADQAAVALERVRLVNEAASRAAMAETQKLRTALLNSLSHDLRTPLTGIRGAAETLELAWGHSTPACRADLLASIREDTARMTRFLSNIMDLTRVESGVITPRIGPVDTAGLIEAAAARVPGLQALTVQAPPGLPALADPALAEQALVNVLENAHRYAPPGSPVQVRAARVEAGVVIEVADEGIGIPAKDLPHVFDSFYRARRGDRAPPGTGLGLAIARGLMEAMGGTIEAASPRPGARADGLPGALITLSLPAAP